MHEFKSLFTLLFYAIGWDDSKKKKTKGDYYCLSTIYMDL